MATQVAMKLAEHMRRDERKSVCWLDGYVLKVDNMVKVKNTHPLNRMSVIFQHLDRSPDLFRKTTIRSHDMNGNQSLVRCFWLRDGNMKTLTDFYRDMQAFVDRKLVKPFLCKENGLCTNLLLWGSYYNLDPGYIDQLNNKMIEQFERAGLSPLFPFNEQYDFYSEKDKYKNQKRLEWIKEHAAADAGGVAAQPE